MSADLTALAEADAYVLHPPLRPHLRTPGKPSSAAAPNKKSMAGLGVETSISANAGDVLGVGAPFTFSLCTFNLWKTAGQPTAWAARREVSAGVRVIHTPPPSVSNGAPVLMRQGHAHALRVVSPPCGPPGCPPDRQPTRNIDVPPLTCIVTPFPAGLAGLPQVLKRALQHLDPDVLLVQELHPDTTECILEALPGHRHVVPSQAASGDGSDCATSDAGWQHEGNIFFRGAMFRLCEYGAEDIGQEEELRRLFHVRLRCCAGGRTLLVATAHFTWQGHPAEQESDVNLRKAQARKTAKALQRLQLPTEPCFFGGDLNEGHWPKVILQGAGFVDPFSRLHLPCRPTHPARPCVAHEEQHPDSTLDWLFCRQAIDSSVDARPLLAAVVRDMVNLSSDNPDERHQMAIQPSDHCPVMAVYRLQSKE